MKEVRARCLEARKSGDKVTANLLTTLIAECEKRAKDDGNRQADGGDLAAVVKKFIKNTKISLEARPSDVLRTEVAILESIMLPATDLTDFEPVVDRLIAENQDKWEICKTKPQNAGWFMGQTMKATGGKANPATVNEYIQKRLAA
jgi:aspartyl-tRNA(Asn)/glutamyl-tRNA(Gln) amidotransferase subunit B